MLLGLSAKLSIFSTLSRQRTAGLWTFRRRFADLIKDNQKARLNALTCVRPCLFLLSLILPGRRRTLYLQTHCLAGFARWVCVALRAPLKGYRCKPSSCRSCNPCKMSCTSSRVSSSVSALSLASSMSSSVSIVIAVNKSSPCRCSASSSDPVTI